MTPRQRQEAISHWGVLWFLYAHGFSGCLSYAKTRGKSSEWAARLMAALMRRFPIA